MAEMNGLSRQAWIAAAFSALASGGIDNVRIERLARTLKASKGSFYWHFRDRADLLSALLDVWRRDFTAQLIENSANHATPRARLEALVEASLEPTADEIDVARAEGALRAWAAEDERAGEAARGVDAARIAHLAGELTAMGAPPGLSASLARALYLALLGLYAARRYTPDLADDGAFRMLAALAFDAAEDASSSAP